MRYLGVSPDNPGSDVRLHDPARPPSGSNGDTPTRPREHDRCGARPTGSGLTDRLFSPILFLVLDTMLLSCAEGSRPCGSGDTASFGACGDVLKVTGQGAFGQFPRDSYANTHLRLWHTWQRGLGDTRHNPDLSSEGFVIPATGEAETGIDVDSESFTVLTASVGTGDPRCLP